MATINSVLGPLDTSQLGPTLCHEHVVVTYSTGLPFIYPEVYDRRKTMQQAAHHLGEAYNHGMRTIVDMTTPDLGRDIRLVAEVSRRSGMQIIATTGNWTEVPRVFSVVDADVIARLYVREIEVGMDGTDIKAGVIKAASDNQELTPLESKIFRAVAHAHRQTGVPISTHSRPVNRSGEAQVNAFEAEGVDLRRVCIGHSNDSTDVDYLLGLLKKGVYLGLDHYPGSNNRPPLLEERITMLKRLIDAGYADRVLIGHDWELTADWEARATERDRSNPDRYLLFKRQVLPRLAQRGVSDEVMTMIMVDNPRRFFEGP